MANQRDKNKKMIGFWVTPEEKKALQQEAKKRGYANLAEFLRAVASGKIKPAAFIVAIASAWLAAGCPAV